MHQKTTNSAGIPREMSVARWLFNPFVRIGGEQALAIGLSVIVVSGLVAAAGGAHFDRLLGFRVGFSVSWWVPVVEGLVNWSVISVLLVLVSLLVAPRTVRLVDIAGTQALARVPLLFGALASVPAPVRDGTVELGTAAAEGRMSLSMPPAAILVAGMVVGACMIWTVWLMWKAFAVSCNQQGARAVAIFVVAVIAGQLATQFLLIRMLGSLAAAGAQGGS